jgi:hypothetical protein
MQLCHRANLMRAPAPVTGAVFLACCGAFGKIAKGGNDDGPRRMEKFGRPDKSLRNRLTIQRQ